jgi:hypothetical protein
MELVLMVNVYINLRFEVLRAVTVKIIVFWEMTL